MKRVLAILFLLCALRCGAAFVMTNEVDFITDESSYDSAQFTAPSYSYPYFHTAIINYNTAYTNHGYSVGGAGAGWGSYVTNKVESAWQPLVASWPIRGWGFIMPTDNEGRGSNEQYSIGVTLFGAFGSTYNGTAFTNQNIVNSNIDWISMGGIPDSDHTGVSLSKGRQDASTNLNVLEGQPIITLRNFLETNGIYSLSDYLDGNGHPTPSFQLLMALFKLIKIGFPTNIGSVSFDWNAQTGSGVNASVSGTSVAGNTLTATVHYSTMPPSWDVAGVDHFGQPRTNDAQGCFSTLWPDSKNWFYWGIKISNLPAGSYTLAFDGVTIDTVSSTVLSSANGYNMFTNMNGPLGWQRLASLDAARDQRGANRTNFIAHSAGTAKGDMVNLGSLCFGTYTGAGLPRGTNYTSQLTSALNSLRNYDYTNYLVVQQTNHTFTATLAAPVFAPFHR